MKIRHFGINVENMDRALEFYRDLLGLKVQKDQIEEGEFIETILGKKYLKFRTVKMGDEDVMIELVQGYHYTHAAFTVKDVEEEYKRLKKKGVKFLSKPQVSVDGKAKVVFCRDNDFNLVELVEEL